jgi:hypothetical protein
VGTASGVVHGDIVFNATILYLGHWVVGMKQRISNCFVPTVMRIKHSMRIDLVYSTPVFGNVFPTIGIQLKLVLECRPHNWAVKNFPSIKHNCRKPCAEEFVPRFSPNIVQRFRPHL